MSEALYFIAIVPPEEISAEITQMKELVSEKFQSQKALNSPPHITLHMPFKWKEEKLNLLKEAIARLNEAISPFEIELHGFDFFEPRVVFVNVVPNDPLELLQKRVVEEARQELKLDNANYKDRAFHPHITIGFRDLRKPKFYEAKTHFEGETYSRKFKVERVELLRHDGRRWIIL